MTKADIAVQRLEGRVLPAGGPLLRDHVRPPDRRSDHYLERFDRTTLYYDCIYLPARGAYLFTGPRLLNFWAPFRAGLKVNGHHARHVRRRRWLRCEQIEVHAPRGSLTLDWLGEVTPVLMRATLEAPFAGLNAVVTVNKNNSLDWISDWAGYYVKAHGAQGVVLFDNGSTEYDTAAIADTLAQVPGLRAARVLSAPYPYGPTDKSGKLEVSPRFFQSAMLNISRRDALAHARAVLNVDIDEIARSASGTSVFDLAARHPLGMVTIRGSWIYPAPGTPRSAGHRAHQWRLVPNRKCNRKWCIRPGSLMDRFGWAVHQIGGVLQDIATNQSDVSLLHCSATTTGWKSQRLSLPKALENDPDLQAFMAQTFPERT